MCAVAISYSLRQLHKTVPSTALSFHCCRSATLNAHMHINSLANLITRVYTHESTGVCVKKYRSFGTSSDSVWFLFFSSFYVHLCFVLVSRTLASTVLKLCSHLNIFTLLTSSIGT